MQKTLQELLNMDPSIRVIGIKKNSDAVRIHLTELALLGSTIMHYYPDGWQAWSSRNVPARYQQICVFRSIEQMEAAAAKKASEVRS